MNKSHTSFFITIIKVNTDFQCLDHFVDFSNITVMDVM